MSLRALKMKDLQVDARAGSRPTPSPAGARQRPMSARLADRKDLEHSHDDGSAVARELFSSTAPPSVSVDVAASVSRARPQSAQTTGGYKPRRSEGVKKTDHVLGPPGGAGVRSSFAAWQGKKFALPQGASVGVAGLDWSPQDGLEVTGAGARNGPDTGGFGGKVAARFGEGGGTAGGVGRHVGLLGKEARARMIDHIRVRNEEAADKEPQYDGALVPRLRPRSAIQRLPPAYPGDLPSPPRGLHMSSPGFGTHPASPEKPLQPPASPQREGFLDSSNPPSPQKYPDSSPQRRPSSRTAAFTPPKYGSRAQGELGRPGGPSSLRDLNLPALNEDDLTLEVFVAALDDSLSVDAIQALKALDAAGPGAKFCDDSFPPDLSSLGHASLHPAVETWARLEELKITAYLLPTAPALPADVVQGLLGDCHLLGALSLVATRPDLLHHLFSHAPFTDAGIPYEALIRKGIVTVQLYKDCAWHNVTVDTRIPARKNGDTDGAKLVASFGGSVTSGESWVAILEKAYAKLHGSYAAIGGGALADAMADLTGGVTESIDTKSEEGLRRIASGELWRTLQDSHAQGHLVGCAQQVRGEVTPAAASRTGGAAGVLPNHAYAVLDIVTIAHDGIRLLQIRNPWGKGAGWTGDWSERSMTWAVHPTAAKQLEYKPDEDQGGAFWISYEDFVQVFNRTHICRIFPLHWHSLVIRSEWSSHSCGGPPAEPTWFLNPQFRIMVTAATSAVITLAQMDPRLPGRSSNLAPRLIGLTVLAAPKGEFPARIWEVSRGVIVGQARAQEGRDVSLLLKLVPNKLYYLVPHTALAGQSAGFSLRIYSSGSVELQRVRQCAHLTFRGAWGPDSAGGARPSATFGNNPQILLRASRASNDACVLLRRVSEGSAEFSEGGQDDNGTLGRSFHGRGEGIGVGPEGLGMEGLTVDETSESGSTLGVTVLKTSDDARCLEVRDELVLSESSFDSAHCCSHQLRLPRERKLLIVPSTSAPHIHAAYRMDIYSDRPIVARRLAPVRRVLLHGEWRGGTAGGSHLNATWASNPQFHIYIPPPTAVTPRLLITLKLKDSSGERRRRHLDPLGCMPGLYLLPPKDGDPFPLESDVVRRIPLTLRDYQRKIAETAFLPNDGVSISLPALQPSTLPYILIASTFDPSKAGGFTLEISSNAHMLVLEAPATLGNDSPTRGGSDGRQRTL